MPSPDTANGDIRAYGAKTGKFTVFSFNLYFLTNSHLHRESRTGHLCRGMNHPKLSNPVKSIARPIKRGKVRITIPVSGSWWNITRSRVGGSLLIILPTRARITRVLTTSIPRTYVELMVTRKTRWRPRTCGVCSSTPRLTDEDPPVFVDTLSTSS